MKKIILCLPFILMTNGAYAAKTCECSPAGIDGQGGEIVKAGEYCSDGRYCSLTGQLTGGGGLNPITCFDCDSTSWASAGSGRESRIEATCSNGTCTKDTLYRCAAGYYGNGTTCTVCPGGGTSPAGTTAVSGCYIPSGQSFSDGTGSGKYTRNCYY